MGTKSCAAFTLSAILGSVNGETENRSEEEPEHEQQLSNFFSRVEEEEADHVASFSQFHFQGVRQLSSKFQWNSGQEAGALWYGYSNDIVEPAGDSDTVAASVCTSFFAKWLVGPVTPSSAVGRHLVEEFSERQSSSEDFPDLRVKYYNSQEQGESGGGWFSGIRSGNVAFPAAGDPPLRSPVAFFLEDVDTFSFPYVSLSNVSLEVGERILLLEWWWIVALFFFLSLLATRLFVKCKVFQGRWTADPCQDYCHCQKHCPRGPRWYTKFFRGKQKTLRVAEKIKRNRSNPPGCPQCCCYCCRYCCTTTCYYCCCWLLMVVMALPPNRTELLCGSLQTVIDASLSILFFWRRGRGAREGAEGEAGKKASGGTGSRGDSAKIATVTSMKGTEERERRSRLRCSQPGNTEEPVAKSEEKVDSERNETGSKNGNNGINSSSKSDKLDDWPATSPPKKHQQQDPARHACSSHSHTNHNQGRFRKTLAFIRAVFSRGWKWSSGSGSSGASTSPTTMTTRTSTITGCTGDHPDNRVVVYRQQQRHQHHQQQSDRCFDKNQSSILHHRHHCHSSPTAAEAANAKAALRQPNHTQFHCNFWGEQNSLSCCSLSSSGTNSNTAISAASGHRLCNNHTTSHHHPDQVIQNSKSISISCLMTAYTFHQELPLVSFIIFIKENRKKKWFASGYNSKKVCYFPSVENPYTLKIEGERRRWRKA